MQVNQKYTALTYWEGAWGSRGPPTSPIGHPKAVAMRPGQKFFFTILAAMELANSGTGSIGATEGLAMPHINTNTTIENATADAGNPFAL